MDMDEDALIADVRRWTLDRTPDAGRLHPREVEQLARAALQDVTTSRDDLPLTSEDRARIAGAVVDRILGG